MPINPTFLSSFNLQRAISRSHLNTSTASTTLIYTVATNGGFASRHISFIHRMSCNHRWVPDSRRVKSTLNRRDRSKYKGFVDVFYQGNAPKKRAEPCWGCRIDVEREMRRRTQISGASNQKITTVFDYDVCTGDVVTCKRVAHMCVPYIKWQIPNSIFV